MKFQVGTKRNDDIDYDWNAKFVMLQILHKLCTENELKLQVTGKYLNLNESWELLPKNLNSNNGIGRRRCCFLRVEN